uniref:3-hydroxyisobutyrate dehydrogenase, mitochondrial-like n=1 Tax=Styela clava TaxID=7725 RepID=UPI00193AAEB8|nr:3-hydroxyisobutyrate dehydrogenase, mitochondrial-like [Styela clava]
MFCLKRIFTYNLNGICRQFSASAAARGSQTPVGFIGLGNMGGSMAENLLATGHRVIVYDKVQDSVKLLQDKGAVVGKNPAEVAQQTERIITMLPSSPHVQEVYLGPDGILSAVKGGALLVDCSTIDPAVAIDVSKKASDKAAVFMDAPVSGGVVAAKAASLTFMVGGQEAEFDAAKEMLLHMGKNVIRCGIVGTGQTAKICNNMLLAISMIGVSEALNLGSRLGLDPKTLSSIMNISTGRCWSSDTYNPVPGVIEGVPSSNNYNGGFGSALMCKDLGLAQTAAINTQTPTPLGSQALQMYRTMVMKGYGLKDFSSVYKYLSTEEECETKN